MWDRRKSQSMGKGHLKLHAGVKKKKEDDMAASSRKAARGSEKTMKVYQAAQLSKELPAACFALRLVI